MTKHHTTFSRREGSYTHILRQRREYYNKTVKEYLAKKKVFMYSTFSRMVKASQVKVSVVLQVVLPRFRVTGKYNFVSALLKIVQHHYTKTTQLTNCNNNTNYNNTKDRTLGISPSEVTPENELGLFNKVNEKPVVPSVKMKLKLGDKVRALLHRKYFQNSSEGRFSPSPTVVPLEDYQEVDEASN
ncbi:uncharacterized protein LOC135383643 [Ornithodoros turicata]|uniref:uncharacterized protein LOC135383643 n=1 Tax=Ornithodoros turicata TaxID=34597 RepID=UPI003139C4DB